MEYHIILASQSPRRRELLSRAGVDFTVLTSGAEERTEKTEPSEVVQELAAGKARDVGARLQEAGVKNPEEEAWLVIAADTIVAFQGRILGKPADEEDAVRTLLMLQGQTHQVYTGVWLLIHDPGQPVREVNFAERTDVTFYPVPEEEIRRYVAEGEPMDKAGSYGIQGCWGRNVKGICGDYQNVVGLPVPRLFQELKKSEVTL